MLYKLTCSRYPHLVGKMRTDDDLEDQDIDVVLSKTMFDNLTLERNAVLNWKKIGLRVQMICAFHLKFPE